MLSCAHILRIGVIVIAFITLFTQVGVAITFTNETERNLCATYLKILEQGVDFFEPLFSENTGACGSGTGFYDFRRYRNWTHPRNEAYYTYCMIPGNGQIVLSYAVLLKYTEKQYFGVKRVPRKILLEHARKAIRWICQTSAYVDNPCPFLPENRKDFASGQQWIRHWGHRQDILGYLSIGVAVLWDELDEDTLNLFRKVAAGTALRGRVVRTAGPNGNGNHDQVKQDLASTIGAAYLYPEHKDHLKFMEAVSGAGLDMVSTDSDRLSDAIVAGAPLRELAQSANLNPDYSSFHHNHPSLWYGVDLIFEGRAYVEILAGLTHQTVPATYTYKGNGFDGVYRYACTLATNDGVLMHLRSPEYDCCYGGGLLAFCYGGAILNDPKGAYLEMRAAQVLSRHTNAIRQYDYHRGSWAKAAMAFLIHQLNPGGPYAATKPDSIKDLDGVHYYPSVRALIHRTEHKWASFVWGADGPVGSGGPGGFVLPADPQGPLLYNTSDSLSGSILEHRPRWIYYLFTFIMVVGVIFFYLHRHFSENSFLREIIIFIATASLISALFIYWIDFHCTLIMRLPYAVAPRWSLSIVNGTAALILLFGSFKAAQIQRFGLRAFIMVMMIIPIALLSMTRTPYSEIFHTSSFFKMEWLQLAILFGAAVLASLSLNGKFLRKPVFIFGSLILVYSLIGLFFGYHQIGDADPFYLRFVSIRNIPRVKFLILIGAVTIIIGVGFKLVKRPKFFAFTTLLGCSFLFACAPIVLLSMERFKQLPKITSVNRQVSEKGFSTAAEAITPSAIQRQAFFSFNNGPCVTMVAIRARKDCTLSWSGLPVAFYQRDGLAPTRFVKFDRNRTEIPTLDMVKSSWWCVNDKIGMIFKGGVNQLNGTRRIGNNWARTESYLDRMDIIFSSPLHHRRIKKDQKFIQVAAGIYVGEATKNLSRKAAGFQFMDDEKLPPGWFAVIAPANEHGCILSIANLSDKEASASMKINYNGWAPFLSIPSDINTNYTTFKIKLKPFETFGERAALFMRGEGNKPVNVKKVGPLSFELTPRNDGSSSVHLRWQGSKKKEMFYQTNNNVINKFNDESLASATGRPLQLNSKTTIIIH